MWRIFRGSVARLGSLFARLEHFCWRVDLIAAMDFHDVENPADRSVFVHSAIHLLSSHTPLSGHTIRGQRYVVWVDGAGAHASTQAGFVAYIDDNPLSLEPERDWLRSVFYDSLFDDEEE